MSSPNWGPCLGNETTCMGLWFPPALRRFNANASNRRRLAVTACRNTRKGNKMEITRRGFVEGVALGAAGIASCGCVAAPAMAEESADAKASAGEFKAGTYIGSAQGNTGMVYVEVVLSEGPTIESLKIVGNNETDHIIHEVEKVLPDRIVAAQSTDVSAVAGATISSFAVINAVEDALEQAGVDPASMVAPEKEAGTDQELTCQALVIGSGPAGLLGAVTLKSKGADVLLVDQLDMVGGTGRFSAGRMFGAMEASEQELNSMSACATRSSSRPRPASAPMTRPCSPTRTRLSATLPRARKCSISSRTPAGSSWSTMPPRTAGATRTRRFKSAPTSTPR